MVDIVKNLVVLRFCEILQKILDLISQIFRSVLEVLFQLLVHDILLPLKFEFTECAFIQSEKNSVDFTSIEFIEFELTN